MTLQDAVLAKLESDPALKQKHRRIYRILTGPDTPQRRKWLRVAEHALREQMDFPDGLAINWNSMTIDWVLVFKILVGLLSIFVLFL